MKIQYKSSSPKPSVLSTKWKQQRTTHFPQYEATSCPRSNATHTNTQRMSHSRIYTMRRSWFQSRPLIEFLIGCYIVSCFYENGGHASNLIPTSTSTMNTGVVIAVAASFVSPFVVLSPKKSSTLVYPMRKKDMYFYSLRKGPTDSDYKYHDRIFSLEANRNSRSFNKEEENEDDSFWDDLDIDPKSDSTDREVDAETYLPYYDGDHGFDSDKNTDGRPQQKKRIKKNNAFTSPLRNILSSRNSDKSATTSSKPVLPIDLKGQSSLPKDPYMDRDTNDNSKRNSNRRLGRIRPNFEAVFQGMPGLADILGGGGNKVKQEEQKRSTEAFDTKTTYSTNEDRDLQNDNSNESLTQEDLEEIERNFQQFKLDMRAKLDLMRLKDPNSVPKNVEVILDQVVEEQRLNDIREKTEQRQRQAFDDYYNQQRLLVESQMTPNNDSTTRKEGKNNIDAPTTTNTGNIVDPVVKEILQEAMDINQEKEQVSNQFKEFAMYEKSLKKNLEKRIQAMKQNTTESIQNTTMSSSDGTITTDSNTQFDKLQLQIMKDLLAKRKESADKIGSIDDEDLYTTNNLEDGIEELEDRLKQKEKGMYNSVEQGPQTSREWQMYRAIATRIAQDKLRGNDVDDDDDDFLSEEGDEDESDDIDIDEISRDDEKRIPSGDQDLVSKQLQAWREFQRKEEDMRRKAGLTVDARLPFPWSDKLRGSGDSSETIAPRDKKTFDKAEIEEARSSLDQTAVKLLTDLMKKTTDKIRQRKLQKEIEELKLEIESRNKKPIDQFDSMNDRTDRIDIKLKRSQPMQMVDILNSRKSKDSYEDSGIVRNTTGSSTESFPSFSSPAPFSSPRDMVPEDIADTDEKQEEEEEIEVVTLGTLKEQKFRSLVARSGVRTLQEQEELRRKWEEFNSAEQIMRDRTGLSGSTTGQLQSPEKLTYNVSEVLLKGGDVNADVILSTIGQRPQRKAKSISNQFSVPKSDAEISNITGSQLESNTAEISVDDKYLNQEVRSASYQEFLKYEEERKFELLRQANITADRSIRSNSENRKKPDLTITADIGESTIASNESDYVDQMYRSLGKANDSGNKRDDKAAFKEYLLKEQELRRSISNATNTNGTNSDIDIETYATDVLSSLRPRPKVRKQKIEIEPDYALDYSIDIKKNTSASFSQDDDVFPTKTSIKKMTRPRSPSILSEQTPDWLRREIEEKRGAEYAEFELSEDQVESKNSFSSDEEDDYLERERQAIEFERKYSKAPKEVSISDLLGRDYFGPDDVGDIYSEVRSSVEKFSSFDSRKATLMEYRVLSVQDLNSLMAYKSSSIDTGVSPYLAQVNKPFSAFGAIFQLEGSLLDISGLQFVPWRKTAEEYGLKIPSLDDVKYAAVHSPDFAVQRIFYWTDDVIFARIIAKTYKRHFAEYFDSWVASSNFSAKNESEARHQERHADSNPPSPSTDAYNSNRDNTAPMGQKISLTQPEVVTLQSEAWIKVAAQFSYNTPSYDTLHVAVNFSPEEAVKGIFMWASDSPRIKEISSYYRAVLKADTESLLQRKNIQLDVVVRDSKPKEANRNVTAASLDQLSDKDLLEIQLYGWNMAAEVHGCPTPSIEDVQLASWVGAERAIRDVFRWSSADTVVDEIHRTFQEARRKVSMQYVQKLKIPTGQGRVRNVSVDNEPANNNIQKTTAKSILTAEVVMRLQIKAWEIAAKMHGYNPPSVEEVEIATFVGPEKAIQSIFKWTTSSSIISNVLSSFRNALKDLSNDFTKEMDKTMQQNTKKSSNTAEDSPSTYILKEGATKFISSLQRLGMPCVVVSTLELKEMETLLQISGLDQFFKPDSRVSASDAYGAESQQLLGAALRLERRPDHCVLFSSTPQSAVAAHEVEMKDVAMVGPYPYYELIAADSTVRDLEGLNTMNLRALFIDSKTVEVMQQVQVEGPQIKRKTQIKTRFWEEGDR